MLQDPALRAELVKGGFAVLVAVIAAGGAYVVGSQNAKAAVGAQEIRHEPALGQLYRPADMDARRCLREVTASLSAQGLSVVARTSHSARGRVDETVIGVWCTKTRAVIYYAISSDMSKSLKYRQNLKSAVESIGGVEPVDALAADLRDAGRAG